jgi:hypothetical protein
MTPCIAVVRVAGLRGALPRALRDPERTWVDETGMATSGSGHARHRVWCRVALLAALRPEHQIPDQVLYDSK